MADRRVVVWRQQESVGIEGVQVEARETTPNHDNPYTDHGKTNGAGFIEFTIDAAWLNFDLRFTESNLIEFIDGQSVGPNMTYVFNRKATDEPPPIDPPTELPDLGVSGKTVTNHGAFFVPSFVDMLSALRPARSEDDWREYFDWVIATGFNGVRVFAGALTWANQTADSARARLPRFLDVAATYHLCVEVTAVTDSKAGYNWRDHLRQVADLCRHRSNVLLEGVNEVGHSSQAADVTFPNILDVLREADPTNLWSPGAPEYGYTNPTNGQQLARDEPWPVDPSDPGGAQYFEGRGGNYQTAHLDRAREFWDQGRRVREIFACSETEDCPTLDNEPGRDITDPTWYALLGALDRAFSTGGGVHHSANGLDAILPSQDEQDRADAYVLASDHVNDILRGGRGLYTNAGAQDSPVARYTDAQFANEIVRHYSFKLQSDGNRAASIVIGLKNPNLTLAWANGYQPTTERPIAAWRRQSDGSQLQLWEVAR